MSLQKINGKFFNEKFSKISQSFTIKGENIDDGRIYTDQIPYRFLRGKSSVEQGGFFDARLLTSNDQFSVVKLKDPITGRTTLNYLGLRFDIFKTMVKNFIDNQASSTSAATQLSASFFGTGDFGNVLSDTDFITFIEEDNSQITTYVEHEIVLGESIIVLNDAAPRFILRASGSDNQSTGIVNSDGFIDIEFKSFILFIVKYYIFVLHLYYLYRVVFISWEWK